MVPGSILHEPAIESDKVPRRIQCIHDIQAYCRNCKWNLLQEPTIRICTRIFLQGGQVLLPSPNKKDKCESTKHLCSTERHDRKSDGTARVNSHLDAGVLLGLLGSSPCEIKHICLRACIYVRKHTQEGSVSICFQKKVVDAFLPSGQRTIGMRGGREGDKRGEVKEGMSRVQREMHSRT